MTADQSLRPVTATVTPKPIMARPPTLPTARAGAVTRRTRTARRSRPGPMRYRTPARSRTTPSSAGASGPAHARPAVHELREHRREEDHRLRVRHPDDEPLPQRPPPAAPAFRAIMGVTEVTL